MKVYLAGKIEGSTWRSALYGPVQPEPWNWFDQWPLFPAVLPGGHDLTGPYFCADVGHGNTADHKVPEWGQKHDSVEMGRAAVARLCFEAIGRSDLVFAWLDSADAFGTLTEIGYARGMGIPVAVAGTAEWFVSSERDALWFPIETAQIVVVGPDGASEAEAVRHCYAAAISRPDAWARERAQSRDDSFARCESPVEKKMLQAFFDAGFQPDRETHVAVHPSGLALKQQAPIGRYRVDFALYTLKGTPIGIEVDGHNFHDRTKEQVARDKARDRAMVAEGWTVLRFSGSEVHCGAAECVKQVLEIAAGR